jgi:FixJ family two-component response regulator
LKTLDKTKNIPVIIITANADFDNFGAVISSGADEFIVKPFTNVTVIEKFEKVIGITNNGYSNENENIITELESANDKEELFDDDDFSFLEGWTKLQ